MMKPSPTSLRRNIIVFSVIGLMFYVATIFRIAVNQQDKLSHNPLYFYGVDGIVISVVGGVFAYYCYRYQNFPIIRITIASFITFMVWFFGVFVIGGSAHGVWLNVIGACWLGLLTLMFFMGLGAVNGLLGFWIAIINITIAVYTLFVAHTLSPMIWLNILEVVGIENAYMQWVLVIVSSVLGIMDFKPESPLFGD